MPRVGNTSFSTNEAVGYVNETSTHRDNLILSTLTMPASGWITNMAVRTGGYLGDTVSARMGIWQGNGTRLWFSDVLSWVGDPVWRSMGGNSVAVAGGTDLRVGFWVSPNASGQFSLQDNSQTYRAQKEVSPFPNTLPALATRVDEPAIYFDYVANASPSTGTWRASAPTGIISTISPLFEGNTPHPSADSAYDYTSEVHLQIWHVETGQMVYDTLFATTQTEKNQGYFSRSPVQLSPSNTYRAKFRHRDSWGVYSGWSAEIEFTTSEAPDPPELQAPLGKINVVSGYNYDFLYTHPNGLDANTKQIQVWNAQGTTLLYDSGEVAITATASGSVISTAEFHADLAWATSYKWRARAKDTGGSWGAWAAFADFNTNAPPDPPTNLSPADNVATRERTFTASVSDPDGDPVVATQIELVNADTNAVVTGYPKQMTVDSQANTATFTVPETDLTLNTNYKWRARSSDNYGSGYGGWSGYEFFRYADVPTVTMLAPKAPRTNLVRQPSAEYDPATLTVYWTETARTATDYIDRAVDGDAAFGVAAWEGVASATGDNRYQTPLEAVDATKPYLAAMEMRKKSSETSPSAAHFAVLCYDGTGALLGTVYPDSIAAANGADVPASWTPYGGKVWPEGSANTPAFPTGTTQYRLEWTPSRNAEAVVRGDAFQFEQVSELSAADWALAQKWFGFGEPDGDTNVWTGVEGDSTQSILPTLLEPSASVFISYSSGSGLTKKDDRLFIEEWDGTKYKQILDTGYLAASGARTTIPVPSGYLKNGGRYRIKVQARDTADVAGESSWHALNVRYDGPPELGIILSEGDPVKAELRVQFNPTTLSAEEFAGIEVAREASDGSEPLEVVDIIRDPSVTEAVYPYPVSGREYRLRVRQVKVLGSEQVEGRWSTAILSVDYWPYFFVKDTDDPTLYAAYEAEGSRIPAEEEDAPSQTFAPWGASKPTILTREALRIRSGEVVAEFYPDALQQEGHEERYEKMRRIAERRRTICVLRQVPDGGKTFASIQGAVRRGFTPPRTRTIEFAYAENNYSEDYREREGT